MSTKLFNGFKIDTTDINYISNILKQIKKETDPIFQNKFASVIFKLFFKYIDLKICAEKIFIKKFENDFKKIKMGDVNYFNLYNIYTFCNFRLNQILTTRKRDVEVDVLLEISFFPLKNIALVNVVYEYNKKVEKILKKFFKPYLYWDCTDKPKNISQKEWEERRVNWLKIKETQSLYWINYNVLFCEVPLSYFQLLDLYDKCKPTKEERAKEIALYQLEEIYFQKYGGNFLYSTWDRFIKENKNLFLKFFYKNKERIQEYNLNEIKNIKIQK